MKLLIHEGFDLTRTKFYIINLTLRPKNSRNFERDSDVSTRWPHGHRSRIPATAHAQKNLNVPYGYPGDGWALTSRNKLYLRRVTHNSNSTDELVALDPKSTMMRIKMYSRILK